MHREGFRVTAVYEADHWWFRSRRDLFLLQVRRAAHELGFPNQPLRLLDFGCGTGFNLSYLRPYGDDYGADRFRPQDREFRRQNGFPLLDVEHDLAGHACEFHVMTALDVLALHVAACEQAGRELTTDELRGLLGVQ